MATSKEYAYYIKGNKVAIVQKDWTFSGGQTLSQPGLNDLGAQGALLWKSPKESIADGLEIQYVYSPTYTFISGRDQEGVKRHWRPLGYTSTNHARLTFVLPNEDFSASSAFTAGDKILVKGSNRWNGIHTVHSVAYLGMLVTTTNYGESSITIQCNTSSSAKTITGNTTLRKNEITELFPEGTHYVFVGGTEAAESTTNNSELFKVTSDGEGTLTAIAQYTVTNGVATESTSPTLTDETNDNLALAKVYYDPFYLYSSVSFNILNDEADELDIPRYLANGIVYYVQAKYAEDAGNIEMKEYFMKEFRRITEKHQSAKKMGTYITQGLSILRS